MKNRQRSIALALVLLFCLSVFTSFTEAFAFAAEPEMTERKSEILIQESQDYETPDTDTDESSSFDEESELQEPPKEAQHVSPPEEDVSENDSTEPQEDLPTEGAEQTDPYEMEDPKEEQSVSSPEEDASENDNTEPREIESQEDLSTEDAEQTKQCEMEDTEAQIELNASSYDAAGENVLCEGLTWVLDDAGTLTIKGGGVMPDLTDASEQPWLLVSERILQVQIQGNVEYIGAFAFAGCQNLTSVTICDSVTGIHEGAFCDCVKLETVVLPDCIQVIGTAAFRNCTSLYSMCYEAVPPVAHEHRWDEGTITTSAGCEKPGEITFICLDCKETYTERIDALGHKYVDVKTDSSCTEQGYTTHTCERCGDSYQDTYTNALGHSWNNGVVTAEATFTAAGVKTFTCTRCNVTRTEAIPKLSKVTLKAENVTVANGTFVYNGKAQQPAITVKYGGKQLVQGSDYTVSYSNNTNAGTAKVTVTGKGGYTGSITKTFTIAKAAQTVTVTAPASVIKGKTVTVKATGLGTVTYTSSNAKIATVTANGVVKGIAPGTVIITGKAAGNANYNTSSTTVKITVNLPTPNVTKVENVNGGAKINVGKITGAAKYRIFHKIGNGKWTKLADVTSTTYIWKKAKSGITYAFTVRCISKDGKTFTSDYNKTGKSILYIEVPTLTNRAVKTMKVAWKGVSGVTGYQVSYATSSKFSGAKTVTVKNAKTLTATIKNLKKGTTYYVRFRTYTTKSGKTTYSAWSGEKSIKISK